MKKNKIFFALLANFFLAQNSLAQNLEIAQTEKTNSSGGYGYATIQVLNKTNAKTTILKMKVGEETKFGQLTITAQKCWQASLDQKPESKILLDVFEEQAQKREDNQKASSDPVLVNKRIFYGWMFASSPSISGLEHPVYDIVALSCRSK